MSATATKEPKVTAAVRPDLWTAMPGWGIAADLTPPEIIKTRQVAVLRKWVAAGIGGLLLVCGGGYYLAVQDRAAADAELALITDRTSQLQAVGRGYSDVVAIQNWVTQVRGQIATTMRPDVDLVALIGQLQTSLPETMTISQQSITISPSGVAGALDRSGSSRIGTVTMNGTGQTLEDLSDYIDNLEKLPGLVDVMPLANAVAGAAAPGAGEGASEAGATGEGAPPGTQFSITLGLTDALLSHRYEVGG